jgi:capsular exopolysaccharide synthesis family protein
LQSTLQGSTVSQLQEQISSVQDGIKALDVQIATLQAEMNATPKPGQTAPPRIDLQTQLLQLDASRQTKQQTLAQLLKTLDDIRLGSARAENNVSLWQEATPPVEPETPRTGLNTALGALAGLAVTIGAIAVFAYLDDRVTDLDELRSRLEIAPLAQIHLSRNPQSVAGKLFLRDEPTSPEAEAFRALRTNISFVNVDRPPSVILVTSARASEGKSVVSANVALAFAEAGTPTILVDADLRRPSQHRLFKVAGGVGLTNLLTESNHPYSFAQFRVSPNLMVIPSGPLPPNPAQLLSSARMSTLLEQLRTSAEGTVVIIDTSPVLAVADPIALASKSDGCLFVIDSRQTRTATARRAMDALARVRTPILGGVLNKVAVGEAYYYYYPYPPASRRGSSSGPARPADIGTRNRGVSR